MIGQFWVGLFLGLVIGWLVEWLIDRVYWRSRYQRIEAQLVDTKDRLRDIKGVGKELAERLNREGIYSFEALAKLTMQELEEIVGGSRDLLDGSDLIKRARKHAKKKNQKN